MTKEKFDITCIGFKTMFTGKKMYHYKLNRNGKEYLLIDAGMIRLLHMVWVNNEFKNSDLWDDFERPCPPIEKEIENAIKVTSKKNYELKDDEEKTFYIQHIINPKIINIPVRKKGTLSSDEVNSLLEIIHENAPFLEEHKFFTLTKKMISEPNEEFFELAGYKAKYETDGDHKNDGQMVEYTFTLKSPKGKITKIVTEMCLMVGWNYHENCKIS